jgi:hypothetical protein
MPLGNTLGRGVLGQVRLGDEAQATTLRPLGAALSLSYSISVSQHNAALTLTYTIERDNVGPLLLYYTICPTPAFSINGDATIISPDKVTYTPRSVVGHTLLGMPVLQGYATLTWSYSALQQDEYAYLVAFYHEGNPTVLITYPDDMGVWQQRQAVMRPPVYGTASTVVYSNVSLTFSRLTSSIL